MLLSRSLRKLFIVSVGVFTISALVINYLFNASHQEEPYHEAKTKAYQNKYLIKKPQYYSKNKEQSFFIGADSAIKNNDIIKMDKVLGSIELVPSYRLLYNAENAFLDTKEHIVTLNKKVEVTAKKNLKITTNQAKINYYNYSITSNTGVFLSDKKLSLQSDSFEKEKNKPFRFYGHVKMTIN